MVTRDIPTGSVAVGVPYKVVCSIEEYYNKRKQKGLEEAKEYVSAFRKQHGSNPNLNMELREEWMYFIDANNMKKIPRSSSATESW